MKFKRSTITLAALAMLSSGCLHAADFTIKNDTSFYINIKDGADPKDTVQIAPGKTGTYHNYWSGFLACATKDYDKDQGCLEKSGDKKGLTQGGYATWFSISFGTNACTVPDTNIYQCKLTNGVLTFDYRNVTQKYSSGPKENQPVELSQPTKYQTGPKYRGINISGLEYDGTFLDAMFQHPDKPDIRYFVEQGMNTVRLPIRWEFVLSTTKENFVESTNPTSQHVNEMYLNAVYDTVEKYLKSGVAVDLDLHNYMRFCNAGENVGQANEPTDPIANNCDVMNGEQLAYIWGVIAKKFARLANQYPELLMFEIMNEPYSFVDESGKPVAGQTIKTADLFEMEVAAVKEIRKYAKNNYILLSGNYWDPLHGWTNKSPFPNDDPNGKIFTAANLRAKGITDISGIVIDMHQYFDYNFSGTHQACQKYDTYNDFLKAMDLIDPQTGQDIFGQWMKDNNMKVFLGEFGASTDQNCKEDLDYMLRYVNEHAYDDKKQNGFIGWTAWRGNRHGGEKAFAAFNFLQAADYTVYGARGSYAEGTGIIEGKGNSLMLPDPQGGFSFSKYLSK